MLRRSFRRPLYLRFLRTGCLVLIASLLIDLLTLIKYNQRRSSVGHVSSVERYTDKIYVAAIHWNSESILRSHWTNAVLRLVDTFGRENVFVSIYESGSWDKSKDALNFLDSQLSRLNVSRSIILDEKTHADEIAAGPAPEGWLQVSRGRPELRRIPYLAKLRNTVLEPLKELSKNGILYDKVVFLNDVVFNTQDVIELLSTHGGDFAAACSMDFSKPPSFYDTFALRDAEGYEAVTPTFPYFRAKAPRNAMMSDKAVPVRSCWNGIVAFDAKPFYQTPSLQFRGISDSLAQHHLEASECCLIHADNPLTATRGVWLNPNVRVGYSAEAYNEVHASLPWPSAVDSILGTWKNRIKRWAYPRIYKSWRINSRLTKWRKTTSSDEPGYDCLINEMQVLRANGWAHI